MTRPSTTEEKPGSPNAIEGSRVPLRVHAALWLVQIAFASQAVEGKLAMMPRVPAAVGGVRGEGMDPVALSLFRMVGGAAVFFFIAFGMSRRRSQISHTPDETASPAPAFAPFTLPLQLRIAGLAFLGIALNQSLFLLGLRQTAPSNAALLSVTIPVFTTVLSVFLGQDRLRLRSVVGLSVASLGVLLLVGVFANLLTFAAGGGPLFMPGQFDRGALLVSVNSLSYSLYLVLSRPLFRRHGASAILPWLFLWGALMMLPFGIEKLAALLTTVTPRGMLLLLYILAMPTVVAYLANAYALARATPMLVTLYIFMQPLLAKVLAYVQLGEPLTARWIGGAVLIMGGVLVTLGQYPRFARSTSMSS